MPGLQDVAEQLSSAFDTRVTVSLGKRKGKIEQDQLVTFDGLCEYQHYHGDIGRFAIVGTPEQCAATLQDFIEGELLPFVFADAEDERQQYTMVIHQVMRRLLDGEAVGDDGAYVTVGFDTLMVAVAGADVPPALVAV